MFDVMQMLDAAMRLSDREMEALRRGEYEETERLAFERGMLVREAVSAPVPSDRDAYRARLEALRDMQVNLMGEARRRRDAIGESLRSARQQRRRMGGYQLAVGQALR